MALSKQVKKRIAQNKRKRRFMAWSFPIRHFAGLLLSRESLVRNGHYGKYGQVAEREPLGHQWLLDSLARDKEIRHLMITTTHHSQAKATMARLKELS